MKTMVTKAYKGLKGRATGSCSLGIFFFKLTPFMLIFQKYSLRKKMCCQSLSVSNLQSIIPKGGLLSLILQ